MPAAAFFCAFFLSIFGVLGSCNARAGEANIAIMVDEGFAALLPKFSSSLANLVDKTEARIGGPKGNKQPAEVRPVAIGDLEGALDRTLARWGKNGSAMPKVVIASPLVANHLVGKSIAGGNLPPKLVVPFAGNDLIGLADVHSIEYDYASAYAAMGKAAGRHVLDLSKKGREDLSCGIVFQTNFMRQRDALDAFTKAYEAEAGINRLGIRILDPESLAIDLSGATKDAITEMIGSRKAVLVIAVDDAFAAEEAVAVAHTAVVLADRSTWDDSQPDSGSFRYTIRANETGLARAAKKIAAGLAGGRPAPETTKIALRFGRAFPKIF